MTIFVPLTDNDKEFIKMLYIYYPIQFQEEQVRVLLNSGSKINAINPNFVQKLDLKVWITNVGAPKINNSTIKTFGMMIADF